MGREVEQVQIIPGRPDAAEQAGNGLLVVPSNPKSVTIGRRPWGFGTADSVGSDCPSA